MSASPPAAGALCDLCDVELAVLHCAECAANSLGNLCAEDDAALHKDAKKSVHKRTRMPGTEAAAEANSVPPVPANTAAGVAAPAATTDAPVSPVRSAAASAELAPLLSLSSPEPTEPASPSAVLAPALGSTPPSSHTRNASATKLRWARTRVKLTAMRQFSLARMMHPRKLSLAEVSEAAPVAPSSPSLRSLPALPLSPAASAAPSKRSSLISSALAPVPASSSTAAAHTLNPFQLDNLGGELESLNDVEVDSIDETQRQRNSTKDVAANQPEAAQSATVPASIAASASTPATAVDTSPSSAQEHAAVKIQSVYRGAVVRRTASKELSALQLQKLQDTTSAPTAATGGHAAPSVRVPLSIAPLHATASANAASKPNAGASVPSSARASLTRPVSTTATAGPNATAQPPSRSASAVPSRSSSPTRVGAALLTASPSASPSPSLRPLSSPLSLLNASAAAASWAGAPQLAPSSSPAGSPLASHIGSSRAGSRAVSRAGSRQTSPVGSPLVGSGRTVSGSAASSSSVRIGSHVSSGGAASAAFSGPAVTDTSLALFLAKLEVLEARLKRDREQLQAERIAWEKDGRAEIQASLAREAEEIRASLRHEAEQLRLRHAELDREADEQRSKRVVEFEALCAKQTADRAEEQRQWKIADAARRETLRAEIQAQVAAEVQAQVAAAVKDLVAAELARHLASESARQKLAAAGSPPAASPVSPLEGERERIRAEEVTRLLGVVPPRAAKIIASRLSAESSSVRDRNTGHNDALTVAALSHGDESGSRSPSRRAGAADGVADRRDSHSELSSYAAMLARSHGHGESRGPSASASPFAPHSSLPLRWPVAHGQPLSASYTLPHVSSAALHPALTSSQPRSFFASFLHEGVAPSLQMPAAEENKEEHSQQQSQQLSSVPHAPAPAPRLKGARPAWNSRTSPAGGGTKQQPRPPSAARAAAPSSSPLSSRVAMDGDADEIAFLSQPQLDASDTGFLGGASSILASRHPRATSSPDAYARGGRGARQQAKWTSGDVSGR